MEKDLILKIWYNINILSIINLIGQKLYRPG